MDEELARRLDAFERRLDALESRVRTALPPPLTGWTERPRPMPTAAVVVTPLPPAMPVPPTATPAPTPTLSSAASAAVQADGDRYAANMRAAYDGETLDERGAPVLPFATAVSSPVTASQATTSPVMAPPPVAARRMPPPLPAEPPRNLEQTLGLKWAGWVGAIVLVIGLVLGVKFAYDQGWLGGVPDSVRCALIAAAGVALIGIGEVVFRRIDRVAATGLYGAGVAVLYLAAYAGQTWYGLFAPPTAIALMAGAALTGLAIAARADLVSIAALAVIGATVCPFLFGQSPSPNGVRVYLLAVQALAIGLCAWRLESKWWTLRGLSLAATTFAHLATLDRGPHDLAALDTLGMTIAALSALLYQAELLWTTARRPIEHAVVRVPGLVFSLLVTAALTLQWLAYLDGHGRARIGQTLLGLAAAAGAMSLVRFRPKWHALGRGFDVQAVLLLTLALAVLLDGPTRLFAWMALAAGLAALAVGTRDRLAAIGAAAVWSLTAVVTLAWANLHPHAATPWLIIGGDAVTAAVIVGAALVPIGHLAAFALQRLGPDRQNPSGYLAAGWCLDIATAAVFALLLWQHASATVETRVGIGYAVALFAASFVPGLPTFGYLATAVLAVVTVKWAGSDVLARRFDARWHPVGRSFFNAQAATGGLLAGLFLLFGEVHRRRTRALSPDAGETADRVWAAFFTIALLAAGLTATLEIDRAMAFGRSIDASRHAALQWSFTVLWAACAAVGLIMLRWTVTTDTVRREVRTCGQIVAYALAAKFVFYDVLTMAAVAGPPLPPLLFNLRMLAVSAVIGLLALAAPPRRDDAGRAGFGLTVLVLLLAAGSAEVNRYAVGQTSGPVWIVRQVGWSVYWAVLAVATLAIGFALSRRPLRLAALALLALTLLKVTLIDLAGAGTGWRILSFLGLGALLLLTSVLYGRFEMRMRGQANAAT